MSAVRNRAFFRFPITMDELQASFTSVEQRVEIGEITGRLPSSRKKRWQHSIRDGAVELLIAVAKREHRRGSAARAAFDFAFWLTIGAGILAGSARGRQASGPRNMSSRSFA